MAIKIPSIEVPTTDPRSLQNTVMQLKEAIELMSGQRGDSPFLTKDNIGTLSKRTSEMYNRQKWDTIFDGAASFSDTNLQSFLGLSEYYEFKIKLHLIPNSGVASKAFMRVGNGTTWVAALNSYNGSGIFNTEAAAAPSGYLPGAGSVESAIIDISWGRLIAANVFGLTVDMNIFNFNKPYQTKFFMRTSLYDGSSVLSGTYFTRENLAAARDSLMFGGYSVASSWSGKILIEGRKG